MDGGPMDQVRSDCIADPAQGVRGRTAIYIMTLTRCCLCYFFKYLFSIVCWQFFPRLEFSVL